MMLLHALWFDGALHVWGEQYAEGPGGDGPGADPAHAQTEPRDPMAADAASPLFPFAIGLDTLRRCVGDVSDSLLASGAASAELTLRLPHLDGRAVPSRRPAACADNKERAPSPSTDALAEAGGWSLQSCRVPTLVFDAADAIDFLTASATFARDDVRGGASLRYWSRVAGLVLELLCKQRFVPAVHHGGGDHYRGYWRAVVDDEQTSGRLAMLIASMPAVCRSLAAEGAPLQASVLVENFLWTTVDALVRRCLEGDELARGIQENAEEAWSPQIRWLRSVVRFDSHLMGSAEECSMIHGAVHGWVARLEPYVQERTCRTCFRLHPPPASDHSPEAPGRTWRLTLHVQALHDGELILDAARLCDAHGDEPSILRRPFANARVHVREDVARAARHFPPLAPCAEPWGPLECSLTLDEAYSFLRDASAILESEGFGVWLPKWWRADRPRLRMWLDLDPLETHTAGGETPLGLDALVAYNWRVALGDEDLSPDEMSRLTAAAEPLVRLRGRWIEVRHSQVQAALRFLGRNRGGRMTVFEAIRQCYLADDLDTGVPVVGLRSHGWIDGLFGAPGVDERIERLQPPADFRGALRPYQLRGMEWLGFLSKLGLGACLADDMGLGKTIQLIALWLHERESGQTPGPTLLLVPMSLVGNWQREIARFAPSLKVMVHHGAERLTGQEFVRQVSACDVVISTYGLIRRDLAHLAAVDWHRIALDEAQNIKNPAAKQAVAIRSLRSVHRVALTGTPVENRLSELWSIIDFLNSGYLGNASDFRRRFAVPIERYHDADRAQRLRHLIRPVVLRRVKTDPDIEVDLPEKMEMKVFCNLTREQAGFYDAVLNDMLGQIDRSGGIQRRGLILATLVKLKQVCNHPAHLLKDGSSLPHRSGKCDRLTEMLEEVLAEGDRALVFTQFRQMGGLLHKLLKETFDREILFLHGGTTRTNRDAIVARFQCATSDTPVLILSLKAGGFGLNLTAASHVFHFDRWWNPAVEDQATDRAHRIGQDKRVQVHKFVCIGTLEERIDAMLEQKRDLADNVVGRGEEWLTELSTEKLREVFALSREAVAED
jgi:SNF2 family DNA or RNA helicase